MVTDYFIDIHIQDLGSPTAYTVDAEGGGPGIDSW